MRKIKPILEIVLLLCVAASAYGQTTPTVHQTATQSSCSNIVALSGAKVDCSHLTPAQKKAMENIPDILKLALSNHDYLDAILAKLNEMSKAALVQQGNSGGINIQQGTAGDNSPIINSPVVVGDVPRAYFINIFATRKSLISNDNY